MTTQFDNISHAQRLERAIRDIVDEKAYLKYDQYYLYTGQLSDDEFLNLCMLCLEKNGRDLGNIFCSNEEELSSCIVNYLKEDDFDNNLCSRDKLLKIIKNNITIEYEETIQEMIDEACNTKNKEITKYIGFAA